MKRFIIILRRRLMSILCAALFAMLGGLGMPSARADDAGDWLRTSFTSTSSQSRPSRSSRSSLGARSIVEAGPRARRGGTRVASLSPTDIFAPSGRSVAGGVSWVASASCLTSSLRDVIAGAASFGRVVVSSTCRSHSHNRRVGGAPRSHHLTGNAVDFRVHGDVRAAYAYLRSHGSVGGLKHYGGGLFHIDTGARRSW